MTATLDKRTQFNVLAVLDRLPPDELLKLKLTEDQISNFQGLKVFYQTLRQSFHEYFSGQEATHPALSGEDLKLFHTLRRYYLSWYSVVQWGWKYIREYAASNSLELPSCPGEALIRVLENDCLAMCEPCLQPYWKWTPDQARKLALADRKIGSAISLAKGVDRLGSKDKKSLGNYQRKLHLAAVPFDRWRSFSESCIAICEMQRKDATLKSELAEYRRAKSELDRVIQSRLHERNGLKGFEWQRGKKFVSSRYGGIAE